MRRRRRLRDAASGVFGAGASLPGETRLTKRMARKRRYLTATMPDGYVKTIGPTADPFTHYWRIVAVLNNLKVEVFWGHAKSLAEAERKRAAAGDAAKMRGWRSYAFEIAALVESDKAP